MTQFVIEEAIMLRLRVEEGNAEEKARKHDELQQRLLDIASRQGARF